MLKKHGVEVVFGVPGGSVIPLYDVLYDEKEITNVLVGHEQGAAHAADGYARASGKIGVCIATSGPGATNLVTGIANAQMDSIPMLAITGNVRTVMIGKDAFQEADITGITLPIVKHSYLVKKVEDLPSAIVEGIHIATTGRPGPVLVDVPVDMFTATLPVLPDMEAALPSYQPTYKGHRRMIELAAKMIGEAKRPVLYVGGGVIRSGAEDELAQLARKLEIPVVNTLMGKGAFPETDTLSLGMTGMHGAAYSNYAMNESDLMIAVGARFDDRVTGRLDKFGVGAKKIHIDIDPAEIGKNVQVDVPIVGDARMVLSELVKRVKKCDASEWWRQIRDWQRQYPLTYQQSAEEIKPQYVVEQIYDLTNGEAIVSTGVGQQQMWAAQYYRCKRPRQFISSGGLGTMGFGLPAAIGAQMACPGQLVFDIDGDGSFLMTIQELATAVVQKLPIKVAIIHNTYLGMVRQWQELFWRRRYSGTRLVAQPDFVKVAEAFGATGIVVEKPDEVRPALERSLEVKDVPCVMDFRVSAEENVFPMVPAGGALDEIMTDPALWKSVDKKRSRKAG